MTRRIKIGFVGMKGKDKEMEKYRKERELRIRQLSDFRNDYNVGKFIIDLAQYFGEEADFDIDKIQREVDKPGKLDGLIEKAKKANTHPVVEFMQDFFKDLYSRD